jgi:hypothetical protein
METPVDSETPRLLIKVLNLLLSIVLLVSGFNLYNRHKPTGISTPFKRAKPPDRDTPASIESTDFPKRFDSDVLDSAKDIHTYPADSIQITHSNIMTLLRHVRLVRPRVQFLSSHTFHYNNFVSDIPKSLSNHPGTYKVPERRLPLNCISALAERTPLPISEPSDSTTLLFTVTDEELNVSRSHRSTIQVHGSIGIIWCGKTDVGFSSSSPIIPISQNDSLQYRIVTLKKPVYIFPSGCKRQTPHS